MQFALNCDMTGGSSIKNQSPFHKMSPVCNGKACMYVLICWFHNIFTLPFFQCLHGFCTVFHVLHQTFAHEVRLCDSVIPFTVLTEAEENGVDCHLIDPDETLSCEVGEYCSQSNRGPNMFDCGSKPGCSFKEILIASHHAPSSYQDFRIFRTDS